MNPFAVLKLFGGLATVLALASLAWLAQDRFAQKARADAARRCDVAAGSMTAALNECLPLVRSRLRADRQERVCQAALLPSLRPATRFSAAQACGAGTKRLIAAGDVAVNERDDLARQLAEARADTTRAVERAEGRATRFQRRNDDARRTIDLAPRDAGGGIACDADCLRRLAG